MCGIAGVLASHSTFPHDEPVVARMCDALAHRGPDDAGTWASPGHPVTLGHRRLAIVDLSAAGHQPMCNEDASVWLTYNGEIYNHEELRAELELRGHRYVSHTDSETIVHLYEEYGSACLSKLDGMFALAIWDERRGQLLLARDRLGVKPLYLARVAGGVVFASEVKSLLAHPAIHAELDTDAAIEFLTFGSNAAPRTAFRGIEKLEPGEMAIVNRDGVITREQWWRPDTGWADELIRGASQEELAAELLARLRRSIAQRMMADVPVGVFLSGGLDSSTNVALVAETVEEPVRTYSAVPDGPARYNESGYASVVARRFATDHHEVEIGQRQFAEAVPRLIRQFDEPMADWSCVPTFLLAERARQQGTIVVQLGEGADEIFHGYDEWRLQRRLLWPVAGAPPFARGLTRAAAQSVLRSRPFDRRAAAIADAARTGVPYWGGAIGLRPALLRSLLTRPDVELVADGIARRGWEAACARLPDGRYDQLVTGVELGHRLPEMLLMRVDKMLMAASVEGREPFLDHRLVELALALPLGHKQDARRGKVLLRDAVAGLLPEEIVQRPKQGFSTPVSEWLRGRFGAEARALIDRSELVRESGLIDPAGVTALWRRHQRGEDWSLPLWQLFSLVAWYGTWIGGERERVADLALTGVGAGG